MPRQRTMRLVALASIALTLTPGTWLRTVIPNGRAERLTLAPVPVTAATEWPAGLSIDGVWELRSDDPQFGGYSALLVNDAGHMMALSDRGDSLAFAFPDLPAGSGTSTIPARFARIAPDPRFANRFQDIEAATRDPATGTIWLAYEQFHAIRRFALPVAAETPPALVRPIIMRGWSNNGGVESLVRLRDGRFLALGENRGRGLLFPGDPVTGVAPVPFTAIWPEGYRPTDAAQLPDGRIVVLLRGVELGLPPFRSLLAIGDVPDIAREAPWHPRVLARLDGPLPRENYEGLAVTITEGKIAMWLVSDDNFAALQRTLLVRLHADLPTAKGAPELAAPARR